MKEWTLRITRPSKKRAEEILIKKDEETLEAHSQDAAAMRGAGATGVLYPSSIDSLQCWLEEHPDGPLIAQGALTSLTGGATPHNDVVISFQKMNQVTLLQDGKVKVQPGALLAEIDNVLKEQERFYPPAPTYDGASIGGNIATNAAGAATFRYGTTREWIEELSFIFRNGYRLNLKRGDYTVSAGDSVCLVDEQQNPIFRFTLPSYSMPNLKKISCGYYMKESIDLLDFFIGTEGTLGFIGEAVLNTARRPRVAMGLVVLESLEDCLGFAAELRESQETISIEFFDSPCLELVKELGLSGQHFLPPYLDSGFCLFFQTEVKENITGDALADQLVAALEEKSSSVAVFNKLGEMIQKYGVMERMELALPFETKRQKELSQIRELIPMAVSEFLTQHKRSDESVHKVAGDMIVPFEHFPEMMHYYYDIAQESQLRLVVYGHISDGNVHPNFLCKNAEEMQVAKENLLLYARKSASLKGAPMSEHGVGRHPLKKKMLENFLGKKSIEEMKRVKKSLDPNMTLALGVLFDA